MIDVLIAGGGPAGCAAALTLLRHTKLRAMVLERSQYDEARPGETVSHSIESLLKYLGIWEAFLRQEHLPAYAMTAAWGQSSIVSRDYLFSGRGHGWHLDRVRFDRLLAKEVQSRGGSVLCATRTRSVSCECSGSWRVVTDNGREIKARYLIDASGRRSDLARRLGARPRIVDGLIAATVYYDGFDSESEPHETLVEATADGWWYSALLPEGRLAAAFFSDPDILRTFRLNGLKPWTERLKSTHYSRQRIGGAQPLGPIQFRPCGSQLLEPVAGKGWIAAGDAAACFDPIASMGIGHAMSSGIHAARAAHNELCGDERLRCQYSAHVGQNFKRYLTLRAYYYGLERRWGQAPFWARRALAPTGVPIECQ